jgi:hypothetical protein
VQVQLIYQPQVREVLEQRLQELDEAGESGDPPSDGVDDDAARAVGDVGDENRPR